MRKHIALLLLLASFMLGCNPDKPVSGEPAPKQEPSSGGTATSNPPGDGEPKPAAESLPAELKHDAYAYYGFDLGKPIRYRVTIPGRPVQEGTQSFEQESVSGGKAIYTLKREGGLGEELGNEKVSVEKDGVYTITSTKFMGEFHSLQLPAKLAIGTTWKDTSDVKMQDGSMFKQDQSYKVVGMEKVGGLDALKITAQGPASYGSQTMDMKSTYWYVKGKGLVKFVTTVTQKGSPPQTLTVEEIAG